MKKSAQRRCKHCVLAVVRESQKSFTPPQTAFPVVQNTTAKILAAADGNYLYLQTQFGEIDTGNFNLSW